MAHEPTRRIVPGAKTAVLFIHGIVGTPDHFVTQIPLMEMVPQDDSLHNLLLDGHGGTVADFSRTSMDAWKRQTEKAFLELSETHEQVLLVAHSMGTLLALELALAYPEKVSGLFLLAVPLKVWPRLFGIRNSLRLVFGRIREDHPREAAIRNACGIQTTRKLWQYLGWIPRYLELFGLIRQIRKRLPLLKVPCRAFQSRRDELVTNSASGLLSEVSWIQLRVLEDSSHFYYGEADQKEIKKAFMDFINP